jgi:hypothetical protein
MIQPASLIAEYDQITIGKEKMHHRRESQLPRLEILFFSSSCFIDGVWSRTIILKQKTLDPNLKIVHDVIVHPTFIF